MPPSPGPSPTPTPPAPPPPLQRGLSYQAQGSHAEASKDMDKVLRRQADHVGALTIKAECKMAGKDWDAALKLLNEAIRVSPQEGRLFQLRAECHRATGHLLEADEDCQAGEDLDGHKYCVVCMEEERQGRLRPCMHACMCLECADHLLRCKAPCPICGARFESVEAGVFSNTYAFETPLKGRAPLPGTPGHSPLGAARSPGATPHPRPGAAEEGDGAEPRALFSLADDRAGGAAHAAARRQAWELAGADNAIPEDDVHPASPAGSGRAGGRGQPPGSPRAAGAPSSGGDGAALPGSATGSPVRGPGRGLSDTQATGSPVLAPHRGSPAASTPRMAGRPGGPSRAGNGTPAQRSLLSDTERSASGAGAGGGAGGASPSPSLSTLSPVSGVVDTPAASVAGTPPAAAPPPANTPTTAGREGARWEAGAVSEGSPAPNSEASFAVAGEPSGETADGAGETRDNSPSGDDVESRPPTPKGLEGEAAEGAVGDGVAGAILGEASFAM